ncbi:MAG: hypothetical protein Q9162_003111 [Coniocarpon cinnabarinum]
MASTSVHSSCDINATIFSFAYRVELTQTYENPTDTSIDELKYAFPLFDGVSVIGFECHVADRVITGVVRERDDARQTYRDAQQQGQTAGLVEQEPNAGDVFLTTLGNVPPRSKITVKLAYVGELKHDAGIDGARLVIPTSIAPRYGASSLITSLSTTTSQGMSMKATINSSVRIQKVTSPSHKLDLDFGTATSSDYRPADMTATMHQSSPALAQDFILQIMSQDFVKPRALFETDSKVPQQHTLMVSLVPKFSLKPNRPEIILVADRSFSMQSSMPVLKAALHVFLKSLPVGVKFNLCSFGSSSELLWADSQTYSEQTLRSAEYYVETFIANFGGTETLSALQTCVNSRRKSLNTEIILLTDGEIWQQSSLFRYIHEQVEGSKGRLRVFPIGIGNNVSSSLIEGVARAGNGFAQHIASEEEFASKIVRMLKGALTPHINNCTLQLDHQDTNHDRSEDFEIIENCFHDTQEMPLSKHHDELPDYRTEDAPPTSLYDTAAPHLMDIEEMQDPKHKYEHLPSVASPASIQAPHKIPALFPFSRTCVYLLLSPEAIRKPIKSITLRARSDQGPLELRIPIEEVQGSKNTLNALGAKKAMQELEEGRGWVYDAKDHADSTKLLKDTHPDDFDDIVEREAVRLGVKHQVAGKWCSFVAVNEHMQLLKQAQTFSLQDQMLKFPDPQSIPSGGSSSSTMHNGMKSSNLSSNSGGNLFGQASSNVNHQTTVPHRSSQSLFGVATLNTNHGTTSPAFGQSAATQSLFGNTTFGNTTNAASAGSPWQVSAPSSGNDIRAGGFGSSNTANNSAARQSQGSFFSCGSSTRSPPTSGSLFAGLENKSADPTTQSNRFGNNTAKSSLFGNMSTNTSTAHAQPDGSWLEMQLQTMRQQQARGAAVSDSSNKSTPSLFDPSKFAGPSANPLSLFNHRDAHPSASNGSNNAPGSSSNPENDTNPPAAQSTSLFGPGPFPQVFKPAPNHPEPPNMLQDHWGLMHNRHGVATALISAQNFDGSWGPETATSHALHVSREEFERAVAEDGVNETALATAVVLVFLEGKMGMEREWWELVSVKGWEFLREDVTEEEVERLRDVARALVG